MIIQFLDGTTKDIQDYNLKRLFHHIPSLDLNHVTENVEGRGILVVGTEYQQRVITETNKKNDLRQRQKMASDLRKIKIAKKEVLS